jgi:hypothetical protein
MFLTRLLGEYDATSQMFQIKPVRSAADLEAIVRLFSAYACALEVDLGYQGFATELANLPGKYAPRPVNYSSRVTVMESHWAA